MKWKWLFMNGGECSSMSTSVGFLNLHQDGTCASMCLGLILKNNDPYMEEISYI
jgi:hypothetical protein